jgi:hypothetical protein
MMALSRAIWLATGIAWAVRSLMGLADPDYMDPVTALDWSSVWLYSAAWLLMAPSVLLIGRLAPTRPVLACASIVAIGAVLAGVANALEDGFEMGSLGTAYVVGVLVAWLGFVPLAVAFGLAHAPRLAGLCVVLVVGIPLINTGGSVLVLIALGALAIRPAWFATPGPTPALTAVSPPSS